MSMSTFGKVMAGASVAIGGLSLHTASQRRAEAHDAQDAGHRTTSSALNQRSLFTAVTGAGLIASGLISFAPGAGTGGLRTASRAVNVVLAGAITGNFAAGFSLDNARQADAVIQKQRDALLARTAT